MSDNADFATYEKVLLTIPSAQVSQIHIVLIFVTFGNEPLVAGRNNYDRHPLTISQLAEVTGYDDATDPPTFHANRCLSPNDIINVCQGILELEEAPRNCYVQDPKTVTSLRFCNEEIEDYLLSPDIRNGPAAPFAVTEGYAREVIANTCLTYILHSDTLPVVEKDAEGSLLDYPFAYYAAFHWFDFLPRNKDPAASTQKLLDLLTLGSYVSSYNNWLRIVLRATDAYRNTHHGWKIINHITHDRENFCDLCLAEECQCCSYTPPIVWASTFGVETVVSKLLEQGVSVNEGGAAGFSALCMAVHEGYFPIAKALFKNGGDVADGYKEGVRENGMTDYSTSPMYYAAKSGKVEMLELLLSDSERFGKPGWRLETALQCAASARGPTRQEPPRCIELLVQAGVDIDALGPEGVCALYMAAFAKNTGVVRVLLVNGANPNVTGGEFYHPLQAALAHYRGRLEVVQLLLAAGADPRLQGGAYGTALLAASWRGNLGIVELLLEAGSSTDAEWDLRAHVHSRTGLNCPVEETPENGAVDERDDLEKQYEDAEFLLDELDQEPGSEWDFKRRIDAHTEARLAFRKKHGYGCICGIALGDQYLICREIRQKAGRIARRLREAGVQEGSEGQYMFTPIQAAVAQERFGIIELLLKYGAEMPAVIAVTPEQSVQEAERWAKRLRLEDPVYSETKGLDGVLPGSSTQSTVP